MHSKFIGSFIVTLGFLTWAICSLQATIIHSSYGTSYQVNVDSLGQNIAGDAANEPSMCIDPNNPNRIAIGWRQFDTTNSDFRQPYECRNQRRLCDLNWKYGCG